ncbi:MAG: hypothetical protein WBC07_06425 [Methylotenera sp.]
MRFSARSTKASAAIDRLKKRTGNTQYSMTMTSGALFCLMLPNEAGATSRLCEPLMLDDFVTFVNAYGPQTPKRESKLDIEFNKQLVKKPT